MNLCWFSDSSNVRATLLAGALLLTAAGCTVNTTSDAPIGPPVGRLIVQWTVDESTDRNLCLLGGAAAFDITVTTTANQFVGEWQASCDSFATTISSLPQGSYAATALLVASDGDTPRTTVVPIQPFVITSSDLVIPVDFPADSFL